jgi:hypothetical protein
MQTTEPLSGWSWPSVPSTADPLKAGVEMAFAMLRILGRHRLGSEVTNLIVAVHDPEPRYRGEFALTGHSLRENAARIATEVRDAVTPDSGAVVHVALACAGTWLDSEGTAHRAAPLTSLRCRMSAGEALASLAVYGDVWLPWDLAGVPQPAVHRANAPRLAAALADTATLLRSTTRPGPPTRYAEPTAAGALNLLAADGSVRDVRPEGRTVLPLPRSGGRLAEDDPLYVPAHPRRPLPGADDQNTDLVFELLEGPEGAVAVAFSSVELLMERMGTAQPWAAVAAKTFITLMARIGADPVYIDPMIDRTARRWTTEDIAQYERSS